MCSPAEWRGYLVVAAGAVLVVASAWKLGFFVSFMGDYFGLLLSDKVTKIPRKETMSAIIMAFMTDQM